jgi:hypothetical protein
MTAEIKRLHSNFDFFRFTSHLKRLELIEKMSVMGMLHQSCVLYTSSNSSNQYGYRSKRGVMTRPAPVGTVSGRGFAGCRSFVLRRRTADVGFQPLRPQPQRRIQLKQLNWPGTLSILVIAQTCTLDLNLLRGPS